MKRPHLFHFLSVVYEHNDGCAESSRERPSRPSALSKRSHAASKRCNQCEGNTAIFRFVFFLSSAFFLSLSSSPPFICFLPRFAVRQPPSPSSRCLLFSGINCDSLHINLVNIHPSAASPSLHRSNDVSSFILNEPSRCVSSRTIPVPHTQSTKIISIFLCLLGGKWTVTVALEICHLRRRFNYRLSYFMWDAHFCFARNFFRFLLSKVKLL